MTPTTCTITTATGVCGAPAVTTFVGVITGETFAECAAHAMTTPAPAAKAKAPRYCRKVACIEEALGYEFVAHLAGTCGR